MTEKERIEKNTADAFIQLYNSKMHTTFKIKDYSDSPDIRCQDSKGEIFNFEITLTEDFPGNIKAALGRSDENDLYKLKKLLTDVRAGKANIMEGASILSENVYNILIDRIKAKLYKDYGKNVGLVVRDTSDFPWNWEEIKVSLINEINKHSNPFDKGIWIISNSKDEIFRII
jgi:hypothetical protein